MARIRSVHPGMFTDEGYMSLSLAGKAAWPGIWTEADDHGVFEWKPITLKARLLPADNVDMGDILAETVRHGLVMQFTHEGKTYGVVKGFLKWQRPREPSYRYPFPQEAKLFATNSVSPDAGLPQDQFRPSESCSQREEEGGKREEVSEANASGADAPQIDPVKVLFDEGVKLLVEHDCKPSNARSIIAKWRSEQGDEATRCALDAFRQSASTEPISWITQRFKSVIKVPRETWDQRRIREAMEVIRDDRH